MHAHGRRRAAPCQPRSGLFWVGLLAVLFLLGGRHRHLIAAFGALAVLAPALLFAMLIGPAWRLMVRLTGSAWWLIVRLTRSVWRLTVRLTRSAWRLTVRLTRSAWRLIMRLIVSAWGLIGPRPAGAAQARAWTPGQPPVAEPAGAATLNVGETLAWLDSVLAAARPHLTPDMNAQLARIRASVAEVLPPSLGTRRSDADLFTVRETVLRYLPETLSHYIALPPLFRTTHILSAGKTAQQLLSEQLALLEGKMREVISNIAAAGAEALLANGRFLRARFEQPDFPAHGADARGTSP